MRREELGTLVRKTIFYFAPQEWVAGGVEPGSEGVRV